MMIQPDLIALLCLRKPD